MHLMSEEVPFLSPPGDSIIRGHYLGEGESGLVYAGLLNGAKAALKYFLHETGFEDALREAAFYQLLQPLQGGAIPTLLGVTGLSSPGAGMLLLELVEGGQLLSELEGITPEVAEAALSALDQVHSFGVAHNDIKLENLLLATAVAPPMPMPVSLGGRTPRAVAGDEEGGGRDPQHASPAPQQQQPDGLCRRPLPSAPPGHTLTRGAHAASPGSSAAVDASLCIPSPVPLPGRPPLPRVVLVDFARAECGASPDRLTRERRKLERKLGRG